MTRHHKHPSTHQLASTAVGGLGARRAARIQAHVAQCEQCTRVCQEFNVIRATLARAAYPSIPDNLSERIESAIRRESQRRLAAMRAIEVGREDLTARPPRAGTGGGWHLPGLTAAATRLASAAGAVAIAAAGSYLVAENAGTSVTQPMFSPLAGAVAPVQQMTLGPDVTYGQPGSLDTIRAVESHTNFVAAHLRTEVIHAVRAAQAREEFVAQPSAITTTFLAHTAADAVVDGPSARRLAGCIGLISPGRTVLLIDIARYQGEPAAVIVTAAVVVSAEEAWVVGSSCSATTKDILNHAALGNL